MTEQAQQNPTTFGKYQILEELGRGGFGIVYKALDQHLDREVALKVLYPNLVNDSNFVTRFRQEARIAAKLDHPNLVPVHDFGQQDGNYYIAMGYMAGGSLKELLQKQGKLEPQAAYEILEQVGAALSYAHGRGIIHRDLKPGNILLDENGKARVADLGFAKVMSEGASRSMSASGSLIGTPAYMAPETWRNKAAQPQTDVYSLGCILYEMLTGKVLFEGDSPAEVMTRHVVDGPEYTPELPVELRAVLDKALKREPDERYLDTKDLLADFKAMLRAEKKDPVLNFPSEKKPEKEPVVQDTKPKPQPLIPNETEPPTPTNDKPVTIPRNERTMKTVVIGLVGLAVIVGLIFIGLWLSGNQKTVTLPEPSATLRATETIIATAATEPTETEVAEVISTLTSTPPAAVISAVQPTVTLIPTQASTIDPKIINISNADQVKLLTQFYENTGGVSSVAWSPDGTLLATGGYDNTIIVWDSYSGEQLRTLEGHTNIVNSVSWSPDGKRLASASDDYTIIIWNADSGERLRTLEGNVKQYSSHYRDWYWETTIGDIHFIAWSPDGKMLASCDEDGDIILWDTASGERVRTIEGTDPVYTVTWSPDGTKLASGSMDSTITLWDTDSGEKLRILEGHNKYYYHWSSTLYTGGVYCIAWSPDGKLLASGGYDTNIILWNIDSGEQLRSLKAHKSSVDSIAWSPDGTMLASGSHDGIIIVWDLGSGEIISTLNGQTRTKSSIAWSPDGKTLASNSHDGTIRLWGIP